MHEIKKKDRDGKVIHSLYNNNYLEPWVWRKSTYKNQQSVLTSDDAVTCTYFRTEISLAQANKI
jgi:hypothetical protein